MIDLKSLSDNELLAYFCQASDIFVIGAVSAEMNRRIEEKKKQNDSICRNEDT